MSDRRVLVRRYALALAELAAQREALQAVEDGLRQVVQAIRDRADVRQTWDHVHLPPLAKLKRLREAVGEGPGDLVYRFLGVMANKGRESLLPDVLEQYVVEADRLRGVVRVDVESAAELSAEEEERLQRQLAALLKARAVRLSKRVDPQLIGGLRVRAGDVRIDGTLLRQLSRLHERLRAVPIPVRGSLDGRAG